MTLKKLSDNEYSKVNGIMDGAYITPLASEVKPHKSREGEVPGPLEGKPTCSLSFQQRTKAERELMRNFEKKAGFTVKDVDQFFRSMKDIKVDKGRCGKRERD